MIKLQQNPSKTALDRLELLRARYREYENNGEVAPESLKHGYRDPIVKEAVKEETCNKCAYCEAKITHISYGDIEHIIPKSVCPDLLLDYYNLTYACSVCNNRKRDYYDVVHSLINPYQDNPNDHLLAAGPMVFHKPGSELGQLTVDKLDLNRTDLFERRLDRIKSIQRLADLYARAEDISFRELLKSELLKECENCEEYSFVVRGYLQTVCGLF